VKVRRGEARKEREQNLLDKISYVEKLGPANRKGTHPFKDVSLKFNHVFQLMNPE
jgi:hypothetical protein